MTVKEAAAYQKVSEITIRRKLWKKQLRRFRVGGRTLLLAAEVAAQIMEA
jgi:excisionase family DNA binding protein